MLPTLRSFAVALSALALPVSVSAGEMMAGLQDQFDFGADAAFPSPELSQLLVEFNGTQDFDMTVGLNGGSKNRQVAHTFTDLGPGIVAATLELSILGGNNTGVVTDGIFLSFADGTVTEYEDVVVYRRSFGPITAVPPFYPEDDPGIVGAWDQGQIADLSLDLSALPLPGGGTMSLIRQLSDHGFLDVTVSDETAVDYMRLTVLVGATGVETVAVPGGPRLTSWPNPFTASATIRFVTKTTGRSSVRIFDVTGRLLRTLSSANLPPGEHLVEWDGRDERGESVRSGVYFYRLETDRYTETHRMVRVR